ncbi:unnamed protein product, partial [Prunus brigantina]
MSYIQISHCQRKTHVGENGGVNSSIWITLQISSLSPKFDVLNPRE